MTSLVKLYEDVFELESQIEVEAMDNEGVVDEEKLQQLIVSQAKIPGKINNIVKYIKTLNDWAKNRKEEAKRLSEQAKSLEQQSENIKKYLLYFMDISKEEKITTELYILSKRKSESVEITGSVPVEFQRQKITIEPDKIAIKEALKSGKTIEGAYIKDNISLIIK